ncbi:MAG: glutathione S-transferase [Methylococcales bacterium]|nr:glutathione S-transferase [Methylococcales bacterium]
MNSDFPILYSFRRCPYAMRARLAIAITSRSVELREVVLRNKPKQLLDISPKGTVPVLLLKDKKTIDESLDIMYWALSQHDPEGWLINASSEEANQLIQWNDGSFKYYLDRYKYADRYPEQNEQFYREKAELFLIELEKRLSNHPFLCGSFCSIADMAIFPFIRQFANVNNDWFVRSKYRSVNKWLNTHVNSVLFASIMDKYPAWQPNNERLIFNQ